jgi:hypothetical protein
MFYFLGNVPTDGQPITLNGTIYVFCGILRFIVASAAEAESGALFLNCKEGKILQLVLQELGHDCNHPHQYIVTMHCCWHCQSSEKCWLGKNIGSAGQNPVFTKNQAKF